MQRGANHGELQVRPTSVTPAWRLAVSCMLLAMASSPVTGQRTYSRAIVYFPDNSRVEVANLVMDQNRVSFNQNATAAREDLALDEVAAIRVYTGHKGVRYGMISGGLGVVFGGLTAAGMNASRTSGSDVSVASMALLSGALAGIIGFAIGLTEAQWTGVYSRPRLPDGGEDFRVNSPSGTVALHLSIAFPR